LDALGSKPILALLLPAPYAVLGTAPEPHLVLGLALAVLTAALLYGVLRVLGLDAVAATMIALLALLFPWSASTRLWATGAINNVAVCFYLGGVLVALRALRRPGTPGLRLHVAASALLAASVLTYEIAAPLALVTGAAYLARLPRRAALVRWGIDVAAVGAALAYSAATTKKTTEPLSDQANHLPTVARDAVRLWTDALVPVPVPHEAVAAVAAAVVVLAVLAMRRTIDADLRDRLRQWLLVAAAAAVATVASYAMFVPSAWWRPRFGGLLDRVNLLAALPMSVLVFAVLVLLWLITCVRVPRRARLAVPAAVAAACVICVGYVHDLAREKRHYAAAYAQERDALARLLAAVPHPRTGSTILAFGTAPDVAPGLPVYYDNWDLSGAVQLALHDGSIAAYPVFAGASLDCRAGELQIRNLPTPSPEYSIVPKGSVVPYGRVIFADVKAREALVPRDPIACRRALDRLRRVAAPYTRRFFS
jgi:hypothetical protein